MVRPPGLIRRGLMFGMFEGAVVAALFVTMESWMVPLLQVRLGAGAWVVGLLTVVPQLGLLSLAPFAGRMIRALGGNKRATLWVCWLQIACVSGLFLPLIAPASWWAIPVATAAICLYGLTGVIAGPSWVSWMGDLIPPRVRGSYQAYRARLFQLSKLGCAGAYAAMMHALPLQYSGHGMAYLLAAALISRLCSWWCLKQQPELPGRPLAAQLWSARSSLPAVGLRGFLRTMHHSELGRWTLVWAVFHGGVSIAGPFFASYMVVSHAQGGLALDPLWYSILIYTGAVSRIIAYPLVGKLIDLYGPAAMLRVSLVVITTIPLAWAFTSNPYQLMTNEMISGAAWALAECSVSTLLFACHRDPVRRSELIGYHVTVSSAGVALGSLAGTLLIDVLPPLGGSQYHTLFLLSAVLRMPGLFLALRWLPPLRRLHSSEQHDLLLRIPGATLTVSLGRGLMGIFRRPEG